MTTKPRSSANRYAVNAISSILKTLVSMTVLVWVNQYLLRRISPEEYALVPVLTSLAIFVEFFATIFTRGISRHMVEADARGDDREVTRIASSMLLVLLFVSLVLGLSGTLAVVYIDRLILVDPVFLDDARIMFALLLFTLCATIATTPLRAGLYVRMRFVEMNLVGLGTETSRAIILLALLLGLGPQALWVVVASTAANVGNIIIQSIYTFYILPSARFRSDLVSTAIIRRLLSFSLWTSVQGVNAFVQRAAPALLLNRFGSGVEVAAFHVGNLPNLQIRRLIHAAAEPASPELTTIYATEGEGALQEFYYRGGRYHLWVAMFLTPPLIVYAEPLIRLYIGDAYIKAAMVMVLLLAVYPFNWASAMFYQIAYATGRIRAYNVFSISLGIIALMVMYYLVVVRDLGAVGAAGGLALGFGLAQMVVIWPFGLRMVKGRWSRFLRDTLLRGLAPFIGAVLACWLFDQLLPVNSWLRFFTGCGISAVIYVTITLGFCLDPLDRRMAHQLLDKVIGRFR